MGNLPLFRGMKQLMWSPDGHAIAIRPTCDVNKEACAICGVEIPRDKQSVIFLYHKKLSFFPLIEKVFHTHTKILINAFVTICDLNIA